MLGAVSCKDALVMARSRKNLSQQVVGAASYALPGPLRSVAQSYWGSRVVVFGVCAAMASGVLHVTWNGGVPKLTVDQQRAAELKQEIARQGEQLQEMRRQQGLGNILPNQAGAWISQQAHPNQAVPTAPWPGQPAPGQPQFQQPQFQQPFQQPQFNGVPQTNFGQPFQQQTYQPPGYFPR
jgi:hypothetical protein